MHALLNHTVTAGVRSAPRPALPIATLSARAEGNLAGGAGNAVQSNHHVIVTPMHALTLPERLFEATAAAKIWTSRVAMHLDPGARSRFFAQLDRLHDIDEWSGDDSALNVESYKSFIRAVLYLRIDSSPSLALMPNGNLLALWAAADNRLSVEFKPQDRVRWLVSRVLDGASERAAGEGALTRLKAFIAPYEADRWFDAG